jgi:phage I-like protein
MKGAWIIIANIEAKDGKAPEWVLLFKEGWNEIDGEGKFLVDRRAYDIVAKKIAGRGNDIVFDYEHQTLEGTKAPAAGWIKEIRYDDGVGIMARLDWTDEATQYIVKGEYRYFSPVFAVRKSDKRVTDIHSVALTNAPKTNHLTPLLAKLGATLEEENDMDFLKKIIAKLGLAEDTSEEKVLEAVVALKDKKPETKEVVAKDVLDALDLKEESDTSVVVASIHALKQAEKGMVSQADFVALQKKLAGKDADAIVAKALIEGKITPEQKEWAIEYAVRDLEGFKTFVAKAPVVIPLKKLPGKETEVDQADIDEATKTVAKMMDVTVEDIKKYG